MPKLAVKTKAVATALSLAYVISANAQETHPIATANLTKPCGYTGLIQFNPQVYYKGDKLSINLVIPDELKALLRADAEAHLLVYFPNGEVEAFAVTGEGKFLEATVESVVLAAGNYQLALVFTQPRGDATRIGDWYNGFAGFTSVSRLKISESQPGLDAEDLDGDGVIDNDIDGDGFYDNKIEVTQTMSVCANLEALRRAENTVDSLSVQTDGGVLEPAVDEAVGLLRGLRMPAEEYQGSMGSLPTLEVIGFPTSGQYVANLTVNLKEFYYQATLKTQAMGIDKAIAGKTVRVTYSPITYAWTCGPGHPNGIELQYLPTFCR